MATRTIIWTALPNGVGDNGLPLLSVHVAPRLVPTGPGDGQLQDFAEWTVWPNTTLTPWTVEFGTGEQVTATVVTNPAANAARWSALFAPTTLVRARTMEDFTQRKVRSYPVASIVDHVRTHYVNVAASSGDTYPDRQLLDPFVTPIDPPHIEEALLLNEQLIGAPNYAIPPGAPNPARDFAQLQRFHTPPAVRNEGPAQAAQVPKLDFHEMCSLAQDHPALLRLLGLVVDLELTRFPRVGGLTTVRVFNRGEFPSGTTSSSPLTHCSITSAPPDFRAVPRPVNVDVADGFLRLDDASTFGVVPVDQDGAGLKAMNFSRLLTQSAQKPSFDTPATFALPVLRARGLGVFRSGRAAALRADRFVRQNGLDPLSGARPGDNVDLFADDLVQGVRFDALDAAVGEWRSLSARTGTLQFLNGPVTESVAADEGATSEAAASAFDGSDDDLYLGEEIAAWTGWSLGAPRPSKAIDNTDTLMTPSNAAHPNGFPLEIDYKAAPGSLPRLRFGHEYQLRGRTVDLAGNSRPLSDPSTAHASPLQRFGRLEPVESAAILLRTARGAGDSVDRVVLRSNYNAAPSPAVTERHLAPPKVPQLMAELHGMFDTAGPSSKVDANAYATITARESKTFADLASAQADGDTAYFDVDHVRVPFLPDPVAVGALLRGLGGGTNEVAVRFDGTWPDLGSVRVVMHEKGASDPPFAYDAGNQVLHVYVDKADTLQVRLSSLPDPSLVLRFGLWQWLIDAGAANAALQSDVQAGRHWMFTPFRPITFVHAVKQPLVPATWQFLRAARQPGDTFATLIGQASFSRKSSARIDLDASWDEYVDDGPGGAAPTRPDPANPGAWLDRPRNHAIPISAPVDELPPPNRALDVWNLDETPQPGPRHELHDTKHRNVDYPTTVFSRFDEYFRKEADVDFGANNPLTLDAAGIVHASVQLHSVSGANTLSWTEGVDFTVDEAAGTLTRSQSSAMPNQVHASWVPRPNDRAGAATAQPVDIPSSARPDAPKLVYVIPTFQWQTNDGLGGKRGRNRVGGGVRVYLERPWWVSGGGEMLGVVMAANPPVGPQAVLDADTARVATQWGVDPAHAGRFTPESPDVSGFPLRVQDASPRQVAEAAGVDLAVAGHAVGFDETRDLWYCDIQIDTGAAYFPFVRLALARWQPSSLGGLDLSPVVLADYVQLAPDRAATVTPPLVVIRGQTPTWAVSLTGPGFNTTTQDPQGLRAQVTVQRRIAPGMTGDLAWHNVGRPIPLTRFVTPGPTVTFTGGVKLPRSVALSDLRILFEEFERIETDGADPNSLGFTPTYGDRVTYADVVALG